MVGGMPTAAPDDRPPLPEAKPIPRNLTVILDEDVAEILHNTVAGTRRTKQELVNAALRQVYGPRP